MQKQNKMKKMAAALLTVGLLLLLVHGAFPNQGICLFGECSCMFMSETMHLFDFVHRTSVSSHQADCGERLVQPEPRVLRLLHGGGWRAARSSEEAAGS